jgi:hypothetical protein
VRNEVLFRVKEQRNILHEISKRKANWIGQIVSRDCFLRQVIEGKIKGGVEVTGRRGRRGRKLLDDLNESRGYSHPKEEALDPRFSTAGQRPGTGPWHQLYRAARGKFYTEKYYKFLVIRMGCVNENQHKLI